MVSINDVYKTVLTLANSDVRGNLTPSELKLIVNDVVNEIYEDYIFEINTSINKDNRGLMGSGIENAPDRIREKVSHFSQDADLTFATTVFQLPSDLRFIDTITYGDMSTVEVCKSAKEFKLVSNISSVKYPIFLRQGGVIKIAPSTIKTLVSINYLRNPVMANWSFIMLNGAEIFNPDADDFADIDLHVSEFSNVVLKTLKRFGINLKESDLVSVSTNDEIQNFNQNNTN
jgi:hypothetical protein